MRNVLKAPPELQYQLAFLTTELQQIFAGAPPIAGALSAQEHPGSRKPLDGDCPICFMELADGSSSEAIVWCKASCGNNIHKTCFDQWARASGSGGTRCVYCRAIWERDIDTESLAVLGRNARPDQLNSEGYVNVAAEVGMSGIRGLFPSLTLCLSIMLC